MIDQDYFRDWLGSLITEYAELHAFAENLTELLLVVELADGSKWPVIAWRAWPNWVVLFTETDEMHTVPYLHIARVSVVARPSPAPTPAPRPPFGFSTFGHEPAE
jgi:hypothetical protein